MKQLLIIYGRLPGLNEYTLANRSNRYGGNSVKKKAQQIITQHIIADKLKPMQGKVRVDFRWYEKDRKRDIDNVAFAKKFIFDALVNNKIIQADSWRGVIGFTDSFYIDKANPRIEVLIEEVDAK